MKTKTGLTIIHNGPRVEVYTDKELDRLTWWNKVKTKYHELFSNQWPLDDKWPNV